MRKISSELKQKPSKELDKEAATLRSEITKLFLERKVNPGKNTNVISIKKKKLAQILTFISEKNLSDN